MQNSLSICAKEYEAQLTEAKVPFFVCLDAFCLFLVAFRSSTVSQECAILAKEDFEKQVETYSRDYASAHEQNKVPMFKYVNLPLDS